MVHILYGYLTKKQELYCIKTAHGMGIKRQEKELTFAQWKTLIRDITLSQLILGNWR